MSAAASQPGTCRRCGCTDDRACIGGCSWGDEAHTLCNLCAFVDELFVAEPLIVPATMAQLAQFEARGPETLEAAL
jgi:hypothetical protein